MKDIEGRLDCEFVKDHMMKIIVQHMHMITFVTMITMFIDDDHDIDSGEVNSDLFCEACNKLRLLNHKSLHCDWSVVLWCVHVSSIHSRPVFIMLQNLPNMTFSVSQI